MDPYWYPFFIFSLRRLPAKETEHSQTRKERKTRNRAPHVPLVSVQLGCFFFPVEVVEQKEREKHRERNGEREREKRK